MNQLHNTHKRPAGFTLIEVLITIVVVSIGLLGLAGLQISGLRANMGSEARSKAAILASDIAERMRANPLGVDAGQYASINSAGLNCNTPPNPFCSNNSGGVSLVSASSGCTTTEMASFDAWVWACGMPVTTGIQRGGVVNRLMNGAATVTCNDSPCAPGSSHTIAITWNTLNPDNSGNAGTTATLTQNYTLVMVP